MSRGAQVDEGYGFEAVDDVLADPFPPGVDPTTVRLPSVPKLRSAEDDEAHHRAYWRAHVWAALHAYRRAFEDPVCPPWLQADYAGVVRKARSLVERATGTYPISPLDSVACHAALKELVAGARALEQTVGALHGAPDGRPADPPAALLLVGGAGDVVAGGGDVARGADEQPDHGPTAGDDPDDTGASAPAGVHGADFFAPAPASRTFELRLSLRGARGLKRGRALGGGSAPGDRPPA